MPVYELTPIDLDDALWTNSGHWDVCRVHARDENSARDIAREHFDVHRVHTWGLLGYPSPWMDRANTSCVEVADASAYQEGKIEVPHDGGYRTVLAGQRPFPSGSFGIGAAPLQRRSLLGGGGDAGGGDGGGGGDAGGDGGGGGGGDAGGGGDGGGGGVHQNSPSGDQVVEAVGRSDSKSETRAVSVSLDAIVEEPASVKLSRRIKKDRAKVRKEAADLVVLCNDIAAHIAESRTNNPEHQQLHDEALEFAVTLSEFEARITENATEEQAMEAGEFYGQGFLDQAQKWMEHPVGTVVVRSMQTLLIIGTLGLVGFNDGFSLAVGFAATGLPVEGIIRVIETWRRPKSD